MREQSPDTRGSRGRFGFRLLTVFIACAALPILLFSAVTYFSTRSQLEEDALVALRRDAKTAGMAIVERISIGATQLESIDPISTTSTEGLAPSAFDGIHIADFERMGFSSAERRHLETGAFLISLEDGERDRCVRLSRLIEGRVVSGCFSKQFLFAPNRVAEGESYWVSDAKGRLILGVAPGADGTTQEMGRAPSSITEHRTHFELGSGLGGGVGIVWPLFLKNPYGSEAFEIGVSRTRESILRPLESFTEIFGAFFLFSILGSAGIGIAQIRIRTGPLESLVATAGEIEEGNLSARAEIVSGDELEILGTSIDSMAERLEISFSRMQALRQTAESMLVAHDAESVGELVDETISRIAGVCGVALFRATHDSVGGLVGLTNVLGDLSERGSDGPHRARQSFAHEIAEGQSRQVRQRAEGDMLEYWAELDALTGASVESVLGIPLTSTSGELCGVLEIAFRESGRTAQAESEDLEPIYVVAAQASAALDNIRLVENMRGLFEGVIDLTVEAIDEMSAYTGDHCRRVPVLAELLTDAVCDDREGHFKDLSFSPEERYELKIAALLHDCGKVATPVHVMDKSTKLETILDRVELIRLRAEIVRRDFEIQRLGGTHHEEQGTAEGHAEALDRIDDAIAFVENANVGGEFMSEDRRRRIDEIEAAFVWKDRSGNEQSILTAQDVNDLKIGRGTLNDEEREIINSHVVTTIRLLERLPFPPSMKNVPAIAGAHHEHVDGTGYPHGLGDEDLSLQGRILGLADVFEALTAKDRPYKPGKTMSQTLAILEKMVEERHIDRDLHELFLREKIYLQYAAEHVSPEQIDEPHRADFEAMTAPWNSA